MNEDRLGTVSRTGDSFALVFERRIAKPVEKVWAALTVPERIADWFAIVEIEPRLGGHYRLRFAPDDPPMEGEIVEYEPLRSLAHTWKDPDHPTSVLRYELEPDGDGCRLRFTQTNLPAKYVRSIAGWHVFLDALPGATEGVRNVWSMERENEILELYTDRLAAVGVDQ